MGPCVRRDDSLERGHTKISCAITLQIRLRDLATRCARAVHLPSAPLEGVGNAGCPLHPRSRVPFVLVERTRVTTSTPERPAFPHAMVFLVSVPVITHGFITRPAIPSRAKRCRVHRNPPRVRDDHDTPLLWGGMRKVLDLIWGVRKQKYFCKQGSPVNKPPDGQISGLQREHIPPVSRTRCSVLHAAPQSRDLSQRSQDLSQRSQGGPRISSAPRREGRRAAQHPGNERSLQGGLSPTGPRIRATR